MRGSSSATEYRASQGMLFGVGVGPGDPELLTLKACRLIAESPVISYLIGPSGDSQAKHIARLALEQRRHPATEIAINMPMSTDRRYANAAYDDGATDIRRALNSGKDVVFLCEGDPLFFGSFMYVLARLQDQYRCQVVPGIASVHAAASTLLKPLASLQDSFVVVSGRHSDAQIEQALLTHDAVAIMKAGQARPRILSLLQSTGRMGQAHYLENIGRENQRVIHQITDLEPVPGPYFSLFIVLPGARGMA